ncbi:hypothetical protein N657DRAFT_446642 [Parathielavia appendiculata]|uniref:Uncharacterized protein n=1 Tax=Parathielavia appendiculata TaxID=2587402 RepID=A0AAN6U0G8_9PEZI|nr:hypothetical protein N657DRAFT_446642 [Parathielavia appendiculata]
MHPAPRQCLMANRRPAELEIQQLLQASETKLLDPLAEGGELGSGACLCWCRALPIIHFQNMDEAGSRDDDLVTLRGCMADPPSKTAPDVQVQRSQHFHLGIPACFGR